MSATLDPFLGQGWLQVGELLLAFGLSAAIGLERQLRGKSAGLRTQTIVGTASALVLIVSKYGFFDVLSAGTVVLDPSRVAAQIVTGIGFLGAGLILTRRGTVRGLTTAASVWETAAIGMAAGAGLWLIAIVVTILHFIVVIGFTAVLRRLPGHGKTGVRLEIEYSSRSGVLRELLTTATRTGWQVERLSSGDESDDGSVSVRLELVGSQSTTQLVEALDAVPGVREVNLLLDEELE